MASTARCFELRTYVAAPGKLDALIARFRDHTRALFVKHGMTNIGYWVAAGPEGSADDTLVYLLAHDSREAAQASWASFAADPDWISVRDAAGERLTASYTSVFLDPVDFSDLR